MIKVTDHEAPQKQRWSTRLERPENATWAKDRGLDVLKSFDLPLQGIRKSENKGGNDNDNEEEIPDMFGTYRYNRGWV